MGSGEGLGTCTVTSSSGDPSRGSADLRVTESGSMTPLPPRVEAGTLPPHPHLPRDGAWGAQVSVSAGLPTPCKGKTKDLHRMWREAGPLPGRASSWVVRSRPFSRSPRSRDPGPSFLPSLPRPAGFITDDARFTLQASAPRVAAARPDVRTHTFLDAVKLNLLTLPAKSSLSRGTEILSLT